VKVTDAMPALFSDLDTKYANPVRNPVVVTTSSILSRVNPISRSPYPPTTTLGAATTTSTVKRRCAVARSVFV